MICKGQAIHIAASKNNVQMVTLLISRKASLDAYLCVDSKPYYNTLHAAIFAEGSGRAEDVVRYLREQGVALSRNSCGQSAREVAWRTGHVPMIKLVAEEIANSSEFGRESNQFSNRSEIDKDEIKRCLESGLKTGKMSAQDIVDCAELHTSWGEVIVDLVPAYMSLWLNRVEESDFSRALAEEWALQEDDSSPLDLLIRLLPYPSSFSAFLAFFTVQPAVDQSEIRSTLPVEFNFTPRGVLDWMVHSLNKGTRNLRNVASKDTTWSSSMDANLKALKAEFPKVGASDATAPLVDAAPGKIQICLVPNVVSLKLFTEMNSVAESLGQEFLETFESITVRHAIGFAFWHGAVRVESLRFILSCWTLVLLLAECVMMNRHVDSSETSFSGNDMVFVPSLLAPASQSLISVWADWCIARALAELCREAAQLGGYCLSSAPKAYFTVGNMMDLIQIGTPILLLFECRHWRLIRVFSVLSCWFRLTECFTLSERIAYTNLPIMNMSSALLPTLACNFIGFGAFTHAFYATKNDGTPLWPDIFYFSFTVLITGNLPDDPNGDPLHFGLMIAAVLVFTIFFMNLFIGVIGDQYKDSKEDKHLLLRRLRCGAVASFLSTVRVVPSNLCSETAGWRCCLAAAMVAFAVQVASIYQGKSMPFTFWIFLACHFVMFISLCQTPTRPWSQRHKAGSGEPQEKFYLWSVTKTTETPSEVTITEQLSLLRQEIKSDITEELEVFKSFLTSKADDADFSARPLLSPIRGKTKAFNDKESKEEISRMGSGEGSLIFPAESSSGLDFSRTVPVDRSFPSPLQWLSILPYRIR